MPEPHVICALVRKRAELAGDIVKLDKQRKALRLKILHVDKALKLFGYEQDPSKIRPRVRHQRLFKRGELRRYIFDIIRAEKRPISDREIAEEIIRRKRWDATHDLIETVSDRVKVARKL